MIFRYLALLLVTALLCGCKDGLGNTIPCTYCGICHNWL